MNRILFPTVYLAQGVALVVAVTTQESHGAATMSQPKAPWIEYSWTESMTRTNSVTNDANGWAVTDDAADRDEHVWYGDDYPYGFFHEHWNKTLTWDGPLPLDRSGTSDYYVDGQYQSITSVEADLAFEVADVYHVQNGDDIYERTYRHRC